MSTHCCISAKWKNGLERKRRFDHGILYTGLGPPGVLGIWGEWLFTFWELGSTGNYLLAPKTPLVNSKCIYFHTNRLTREECQIGFLVCFFPLKLLIFRLVITYFGTPQIAPDHTIFVKKN